MEEGHLPVLAEEVMKMLAPRPGSLHVDCTVGGGGHTERILEAASPDGRVLGLDADPAAIARVGERLARFGDRLVLRQANFRELADVAPAAKVAPRVALLTGLRPTGSLTLANVVGAVQPLLGRQQLEQQPILLFVADLHALTDNEPAAVPVGEDQLAHLELARLLARRFGTPLFVYSQRTITRQFERLTAALARVLGPRLGAEELTHQLNCVYDALIAEVECAAVLCLQHEEAYCHR